MTKWSNAQEDQVIKYRLKAYFTKPSPPGSPIQSPHFAPTIPTTESQATDTIDTDTIEKGNQHNYK